MREKDDKQLLEEIKILLILIASKLGAKQDEIGKSLGVSGNQVGNIISGFAKKRGKKNE